MGIMVTHRGSVRTYNFHIIAFYTILCISLAESALKSRISQMLVDGKTISTTILSPPQNSFRRPEAKRIIQHLNDFTAAET